MSRRESGLPRRGPRQSLHQFLIGRTCLCSIVAVLVAAAAPAAFAGTTELVSVGPKRVQAKSLCDSPTISAHGRFVAFDSSANNLVTGDTNESTDVFLRDRVANSTQRVSVADNGAQANSSSIDGIVVGAGRYIGFNSMATNLVEGDTNQKWDGFIRDRSARRTVRVTVSSTGEQANADAYLWGLTADGRYAVIVSDATNLVPNDLNDVADVFVRDLVTSTTKRVSVGPGGQESNGMSTGAAISENGRYVAFESEASNLVPHDNNRASDIFLRDLVSGRTERVSVATGGAEANGGSYQPSVSADGRFVAFWSVSTDLVRGGTIAYPNVFLRDRKLGTTRWLSVPYAGRRGEGGSGPPKISADGRFVSFVSDDSTLVPGDTNGTNDIFVRDVSAGKTVRVNLGPSGRQANRTSENQSISADGRVVAFSSDATNLVPNDRNGVKDVFVHGTQP